MTQNTYTELHKAGQKHLIKSLFYNKGLNLSCNLLSAVLKVKNSIVAWVEFHIIPISNHFKWGTICI